MAAAHDERLFVDWQQIEVSLPCRVHAVPDTDAPHVARSVNAPGVRPVLTWCAVLPGMGLL
eukprot:3941930-Rhodomonas_salina.6